MYLRTLKKMLLVQYPKHAYLLFKMGWSLTQIRPTSWLYDPDARTWQALPCSSPNLFARAAVYDPDTRQVIASDGRVTWTFAPEACAWRQQLIPDGPTGYHLSLDYDTYLSSTSPRRRSTGGEA